MIDPGFCLDLISSNGITAVEAAYPEFCSVLAHSSVPIPRNHSGDDLLMRELDCAVINYLHTAREANGAQPFDSVRGVFMEGEHIYENSGFRGKTHIQLCIRNPTMIKGVFRVPAAHFTDGGNPDAVPFGVS